MVEEKESEEQEEFDAEKDKMVMFGKEPSSKVNSSGTWKRRHDNGTGKVTTAGLEGHGKEAHYHIHGPGPYGMPGQWKVPMKKWEVGTSKDHFRANTLTVVTIKSTPLPKNPVHPKSRDEYTRIQSCTTAKQIWGTLQVAHEVTPQVKRSRETLLYSQYEKFAMKEGETIQEMYTKFTTLTNELKSLGRIIPGKDRVKKILNSVLPITWESKVTAIQKSNNNYTLPLDELIRNLTAYEIMKRNSCLKNVHALESTILKLRYENLKLKLGTGKKIVDHTLLTLEENVGKMKDRLYKRDEQNQFLSREDLKGGNVSFGNGKKGKIIGVGKEDNELTCLSVLDNDFLLWHKRLGHASLSQLNKLVSKDLVIGLPKIKFKKDKVCEACSRGKQKKVYMWFFDETNILFERQEQDDEAIGLDADFVNAMQYKLNQFERIQVWHLVPRPKDRSVIGTKWVFRNKFDVEGIVTRNKTRLVVQGYSQDEGIDYDETFAPVARLEAIRLHIAFAAYMEFTLH
ncbi:uncharacterized protein [Nicotiana tomentosiformis]|uniref:uncharacterized protein n=1 Tax=Nicotiana tomentosiformis TaxID=4098 RepID=UPI00388C4378